VIIFFLCVPMLLFFVLAIVATQHPDLQYDPLFFVVCAILMMPGLLLG